jgi:poly-gamma-glutamate capsule biosynthesis protein CapA/YwtB (metallophosphatase superfamily)
MVRAGPARVALLSYTYGFNGYPAPNGETWRSNPIDPARIERDALRARRRGADVVVVALHWGDEYTHEPNAQQAQLAPQLIRSPNIDLLVGHHAHVVQPFERVGREWVAYGLGNLVARHATPGAANAEGIAARFTFTERSGRWQVSRVEYGALLMVTDRTPMRLVDVERALADPATDPALRDRLVLARDRTRAVVSSRGAAAHGLTPIRP